MDPSSRSSSSCSSPMVSPMVSPREEINFTPIMGVLKGAVSLTVIDSQVNEATKAAFMELANKRPYAFGRMKAPETFLGAVKALKETTRAINPEGYIEPDLKAFVKQQNNTVAGHSFKVLEALHQNSRVYPGRESFKDDVFTNCIERLVSTLKSDPALVGRSLVSRNDQARSMLQGFQGCSFAPAFLEEVSPNIVKLDLSYLWVDKVLPSIGELTSLVELDLSKNGFRELPDSLGNLTHLRRLNLKKCMRLAALPDTLGGCQSLQKLILRGTLIRDLPTSVLNLNQLKGVDLRNTPFRANTSAVYQPLMAKGVKVKTDASQAALPTDTRSAQAGPSEDPRAELLSALLRAQTLPAGMGGMPGGMPGGMRGMGSGIGDDPGCPVQ